MNLSQWRGSRAARRLFWAAAAFAFVMAVLPHPPSIPGNPNDKLQHMAAFGTLALLGGFAFPATNPVMLLLRLSLFGAFIEVVQAIPVLHRNCDPLDWIADTFAAGFVVLLTMWIRRRH